jgi:hypothetical protein
LSCRAEHLVAILLADASYLSLSVLSRDYSAFTLWSSSVHTIIYKTVLHNRQSTFKKDFTASNPRKKKNWNI